MRRISRGATGAVVLIWAVMAAASAARAQEAPKPADLLRQAYEASKDAATPEQLQKVIDLCSEGLKGELDEKNAAYGKTLKAWALNKRGEAQADEGDEAAAWQDFNAAIELDPTNWRARHNRAISNAMTGKYDEAAKDFDQVIEDKPDYAKAWFNRGELRAVRGDFKASIQDYDRALALAPRDPQTLTSRGNARHLLGERQAALDDFNRAVQLAPDFAPTYVQRAAVLADFGRYPEAADDYRAAVRLAPDYGPAYQAAAWLMSTCPDERFRDSERAVLAAEKAIELDGDQDFHYLDTLAAAQASAGQFDKAKATMKKALSAAPKGSSEVQSELKARLALYEKSEAYREQRTPRSAAKPDAPR